MARANTREQILEAGQKFLVERGFNGVGVQEITAAAGVPKGSFYNHFESKEALGKEVVERYSVASRERRHAILGDKSLPPLERLRAYFEMLNARFVGSGFQNGCLLGNFSAELSNQSPVIRESLQGMFTRWTRDLEAVLREAQAEKAIATQTDAAALAGFILDAYEGAVLRSRVERTNASFERFMQLVFKQILV